MERELFESDGAADFIRELLDRGKLESPADGVARQLLARDVETLTDRQWYAFKEAMQHHYIELCERCSTEIPWEESIPKLVETRVTSGRSGCGMSLAIGMDDPEFLLNRGTERREVAIAE